MSLTARGRANSGVAWSPRRHKGDDMRIRSAVFATMLASAALAVPSIGNGAVGFMQYFAVLDAGNELDGGHAGATGTAMVMLAPRTGSLCFAIAVRDLDK